MPHRIVVGVTGSPSAGAALDWAAGEARLRDAELVAWTIEDRRPGTDAVTVPVSRTALEELTGGYPLTVRHGRGDHAAMVVAASAGADLLVIGSRGRGRLPRSALGSVTRACLAHAPCPVVVVRPQPEPLVPRQRVVVGVDGTGDSRQALRVAADEARLRAAALAVVHAVHWDSIGTELMIPTPGQLAEWGHKLVAAELAATGVVGTPDVVPGHAAEVLVRQSADADLLVVGSRGQNPVARLLLGSTSEHCVRHARCPVMVTRAPVDRQPGGPAQVFADGAAP